jgi:hypothetical protein
MKRHCILGEPSDVIVQQSDTNPGDYKLHTQLHVMHTYQSEITDI